MKALRRAEGPVRQVDGSVAGDVLKAPLRIDEFTAHEHSEATPCRSDQPGHYAVTPLKAVRKIGYVPRADLRAATPCPKPRRTRYGAESFFLCDGVGRPSDTALPEWSTETLAVAPQEHSAADGGQGTAA